MSELSEVDSERDALFKSRARWCLCATGQEHRAGFATGSNTAGFTRSTQQTTILLVTNPLNIHIGVDGQRMFRWTTCVRIRTSPSTNEQSAGQEEIRALRHTDFSSNLGPDIDDLLSGANNEPKRLVRCSLMCSGADQKEVWITSDLRQAPLS